jgi:hypothetical protein
MSELRGLLGLLLVVAVLAQGLRGLLLGLTVLALNELVHQLVRLERPWRRPRPPSRGPRRLVRPRWLGPPAWLRRTWSRRPSWARLPSWLRHQPASSRSGFAAYDRILGEIAWASYSRRDFETGLRLRLLDAVAVRLADDHGVDLRTQPDLARQRLGDDAWALLAPDRPPSRDRDAPGVDLPELDRVVTAIERLRRTHERNS